MGGGDRGEAFSKSQNRIDIDVISVLDNPVRGTGQAGKLSDWFPGTQEPKGTAREVARSAWERRCSGPDRVVSKWICGIWADFDQAAGLRSRRYEF